VTDTVSHQSPNVESISPSLNLGAIGAARSTWLGPAWAALCGLIASAAFSFDAPNVLRAVLVLVLSDWAWPAVWLTCVRTNWVAPIARWRDVHAPPRAVHLPFLQPGSPGDRLVAWGARFGAWWRCEFAPKVGTSLSSALAALVIAVMLSAVLGWRALALTLALLALTGIGTLRAARTGLDSDLLRASVYGVLPWWLGHAAFAPLSVESAGFGVIFGLAYRAVMQASPGSCAPSAAGLVAPQIIAAIALFAGDQPSAAFAVVVTLVAQAALHAFLVEHAFARRAQVWLMAAMLICAAVIA